MLPDSSQRPRKRVAGFGGCRLGRGVRGVDLHDQRLDASQVEERSLRLRSEAAALSVRAASGARRTHIISNEPASTVIVTLHDRRTLNGRSAPRLAVHSVAAAGKGQHIALCYMLLRSRLSTLKLQRLRGFGANSELMRLAPHGLSGWRPDPASA